MCTLTPIYISSCLFLTFKICDIKVYPDQRNVVNIHALAQAQFLDIQLEFWTRVLTMRSNVEVKLAIYALNFVGNKSEKSISVCPGIYTSVITKSQPIPVVQFIWKRSICHWTSSYTSDSCCSQFLPLHWFKPILGLSHVLKASGT